MSILAVGARGDVGRRTLRALTSRDAGMVAVAHPGGDRVLDEGPVASGELDVREAPDVARDQADTLLLFEPDTADGLAFSTTVLDAARRAGVERVVVLVPLHVRPDGADRHATPGYELEQLVERYELPATVVRCAPPFDDGAAVRDWVLEHGVYPVPVRNRGVAFADPDDLAETAALVTLEHDRAPSVPHTDLEVIGPEPLTGERLAEIWSELTGRPVRYAGDDLDGYERFCRQTMPDGLAHDSRARMADYQRDGLAGRRGAVHRLVERLGRPLFTYAEWADSQLAGWSDKVTR